MVLPKRTLDNGLNGYNSATTIPKARRSIRKRRLCSNRREGGQLCAFELLATVAGKLLEESTECSSASSSAALRFVQHEIKQEAIKKEIQDVDKPFGGEHDEQGSSEGSVFFSDIQRDISRRRLEPVSEKIGEHAPPISSSAYSNKVDSDSQLATQESDGGILKSATNLDKGINGQLDINVDTNTDEKVKLPLCADSNPNNASFLKKHENHVIKGCKYDDEILSRYSQPNNTMKAYRSSTHFADRKTNRLLTSKCWKTAPKLKDYEPSNMGAAVKHVYHNKRSDCDLDRSQRNTPIKKRKLFDRSSVVTCEGGISCESVSNSPEKSVDGEKASARKLHEGNRTSSSEFERQESCSFGSPHVRLSVNSFEIPELFIDVPESTTIGSLKRTVLEAVTSILSGGLRVGILVQGKKIQDDNKTLLQTNLSQNDDNTDTIAFMLEPKSPTYSEDAPIPLPCESPKFVNRSQVHVNEDMYPLDALDKPCMTDSNSPVESGGDLVLSPTTELDDKHLSDSKALVALPEGSVEPLAVVPVNQRLKRCEIGQRRTRRPFSVTEVEALVHAVEKLGTGRWRDVKLCSFENEKHRTYVDLKDKWKTLVHTARISPQQRRGEPVPQELLDRVLATQTYWSDHQAKQHGKHQQAIIPKLDSPAVKA